MTPGPPDDDVLPAGYLTLFDQIKTEVQSARVSAARAVNVEAIQLYWRIGSLLRARRAAEGWGHRIVERLSADLKSEFPAMRGLSPRSLEYMQTFAGAWPESIAGNSPLRDRRGATSPLCSTGSPTSRPASGTPRKTPSMDGPAPS